MTQGARVWLHLLTRDVQRALAARVPYGMRGTTPPARTSEPPGGPGDSLAMLTLPSLGAPAGGTPHSHAVQRICYTLNALPDGQRRVLQRTVGALSEPQMEQRMVVQAQVQEFSVCYFDGQTWYAEWQRAALPRAVEITLID